MSTLAIDNFQPSAGGTSFGIEGIAKVRWAYDQTTPTVLGSVNVSSITDNAAGDYTPNFTNNMNDANYSVGSQSNSNANAVELFAMGPPATTDLDRMFTRNNSSTAGDCANSGAAIHGDLA